MKQKFYLFPYPRNWGGQRTNHKQVVDLNLNTFSSDPTIEAITSVDGTPSGTAQRVSHVFSITEGVVSFADSQTIGSISIASDEFEDKRYTFKKLTTAVTMARANLALSVSGTPKTYRLALLDDTDAFILDDGAFSVLDMDRTPVGNVRVAADGSASWSPGINNMSPKWSLRLQAKLYGTVNPKEKAYQLLAFMSKNPHCFIAMDAVNEPFLIFPCVFPNVATQLRYLSQRIGAGKSVSFSVRER